MPLAPAASVDSLKVLFFPKTFLLLSMSALESHLKQKVGERAELVTVEAGGDLFCQKRILLKYPK